MGCEAFPDASFLEMNVDYTILQGSFWETPGPAGGDDSRTGACAAKLAQHTERFPCNFLPPSLCSDLF